MPAERDRGHLEDMLTHAREAMAAVAGRPREDLETDRFLNLALQRLVEVVGEAATRVSDELRQSHPELPWRQIIGMRNRLIHGYDLVDNDILWATVQYDFPELSAQLQRLLNSPL